VDDTIAELAPTPSPHRANPATRRPTRAMDPGADISLPGVALLVTELRANTSAHTTPMSDNWVRLAAGVPACRWPESHVSLISVL
jgi:hypothetical protein